MGFIKELGENGLFVTSMEDRVELICNECKMTYSDGRPIRPNSIPVVLDEVDIDKIECPKCHSSNFKLTIHFSPTMAIPSDPIESEEDIALVEDVVVEDREEDSDEAKEVDKV